MNRSALVLRSVEIGLWKNIDCDFNVLSLFNQLVFAVAFSILRSVSLWYPIHENAEIKPLVVGFLILVFIIFG